jgi:ADP-ribosyl-[dinitrogen reductase] hydrolase
MTFCPGKKDAGLSGRAWNRNLEQDLDVIKAWNTDAVVTLLESFELDMLSVSEMPQLLRQRNIEWYHLPIRDVDIPDLQFEIAWREQGIKLRQILTHGGRIVLHCRGGIGRTGTIAAKLLVEFGYKPADAIIQVRKARPGAIETNEQEQYVLNLKKWPNAKIAKGLL